MAVITKHNRNGYHGSTICDFWLLLTPKMADNMIADQRLSQNFPSSQTRISKFSDVQFNLIQSGFHLISHKV